MPSKEPITIVGAGLVGSLLATVLARRGYRVTVLERRPDMRKQQVDAGRSINLAVSVRGLSALREVGLEADVLEMAIPMRGRMIHPVKGDLNFQPYGTNQSECINSVSRGDLNKLLMTAAEKAGAKIEFNRRVEGKELETLGITIGTDGSASALRHEWLPATETPLSYGYKELTLPGKFVLEKNALHIWPRGTFMLIALPNYDGSFTCTLFLSFKGEPSFEKLPDEGSVQRFFETQFPDFTALVRDLADQFAHNPTGHMVTVKCFPWHVGGKLLLMGDAAHAIVPFFGQGMNAGFEDVSLFAKALDSGADWETIFAGFDSLRKPDADAIADMAVENFIEMRDKVGDPGFQLAKQVEKILEKEFPDDYVSRYRLVTFTRVPYGFARKVGEIDDAILAELCDGIDRAEQVNLEKARQLVKTKLSPVLNTV